jgi:hypothetical protein
LAWSVITQQHVHDPAVLVDGAEGVPPAATNLEEGLVDPPLPSDRVTVLACDIDEPRCERVDPVINRARVDRDAPLGQPLGEIGLAEAEAQIPADGQRDDLVREAVAAEGRG